MRIAEQHQGVDKGLLGAKEAAEQQWDTARTDAL
jgi:hypothetical protein